MTRSVLKPYALALLVMGVTTLLAWLLQPYVSLPNLVLLFVLAVVVVAFFVGNGPSVLAAVSASVLYGVLYVPWPYLNGHEHGQYLLTGVITLLLSLLISQLVVRWRDVALALKRLQPVTRALDAERLRNSVLSALSHDLRTPLAGLVGASSSLLSPELVLTEAQRRELTQLIYDESVRIQAMVDNLLELARLEAGSVALSRDWQALEEILGPLTALWRQRLAPRRVQLHCPADVPLIRADPRLLERVFANLLENAGKYTPPDTTVQIHVTVTETTVQIQLSDDGPGFLDPPELLFQRFYRGDQAQRSQGAGLGLAIAHAIVEAHGGTLSASTATPHGAQFTVVLPRDREDESRLLLHDEAPT